MHVFISWSGDRSKALAAALRDWLDSVIQGCQPWMSAADIKAGQQWQQEIGAKLNTARFGIVCITPENKNAPWLNFEAGSISKSIEGKEGRVAGLLLDLAPSEVEGPLTVFQLKRATEERIWDVLKSVNDAMSAALPEAKLRSSFMKWWPDLKEKLEAIPRSGTSLATRRPQEEMLAELVDASRRIEKALSDRQTLPWSHGNLLLEPENTSAPFGILGGSLGSRFIPTSGTIRLDDAGSIYIGPTSGIFTPSVKPVIAPSVREPPEAPAPEKSQAGTPTGDKPEKK